MNKKGISMISLVVIVIVLIILVSIATTAGYRYITQINTVRAQALGSTIGSAAYRRQNDVSSGVAGRFYDGYLFDVASADFTQIDSVPMDDLDYDGVPDSMQEEGALWYLIDAESATNLGADNAEAFLTRNIASFVRPDITDEEKKQEVRVVLADYSTGTGYFVKMPVSVVISSINQSVGDCPNSPTGKHKFTIATCTEPSKCIYNCGVVGHEALGHSWIESTCTADGYCKRCGIVNPDDSAKGHLMISNANVNYQELIDILAKNDSYMIENLDDDTQAWIADANKHWHQCIRCGARFNEEVHDRAFYSLDEKTHQEVCAICDWHSVVSLHKISHSYTYDGTDHNNTHIVWCEACSFGAVDSVGGLEIHDDSGWQANNPVFHYRICRHSDTNYCNTLKIDVTKPDGTTETVDIIYKEAHYDNNGDYACDVCGRLIDDTGPGDFGFEDFGSYARIKKTTTSTISLEAFTVDKETSVHHYNFGKVNSAGVIEWGDDVVVSSPTQVAEYTFDRLISDTEYKFYVRATDVNGNSNNPYEIVGRTQPMPDFKGLAGIPDGYVKPPYEIGIQEIDTDLPNISFMYRHNYGNWSNPIPIENIPSFRIALNKEVEFLSFKLIDDMGSESPVHDYEVNCIDETPPSVYIDMKMGDDSTVSALYHQATITIRDSLAGIETNTPIKYGWSTSRTAEPSTSSLITVNTTNLELTKATSFDVATPTGVNGSFYLWVMRGVEDAVGNATTEPTVGTMVFVVDDEVAEISEITMLNVNPPSEVEDEHLFVKTGGTVTVTFKADKALKMDPVVRINGVNMDVSHSGLDYTCTLQIDSSFKEGILQLSITDVMSINGRSNSKVYTNDDIQDSRSGPVYYDKTLPVLEYIPKKN